MALVDYNGRALAGSPVAFSSHFEEGNARNGFPSRSLRMDEEREREREKEEEEWENRCRFLRRIE